MSAGNLKRIESCRKIGSIKKLRGHKIEDYFNKQFNTSNIGKIEYGATSDCEINLKFCKDKNKVKKMRKKLVMERGQNDCSIKSGNTIQFTLGNIPELKVEDNLDVIKSKSKEIFNKYLKKSESNSPSDLLVYYHNDSNKWVFFKMDDVISYISEKCMWRKLKSGRLKGNFNDSSKKGNRQYLTYECRTRGKGKKSYFLGANGGKNGKKFIELLMDNKYGIKKYMCDFDY
tara:strand:- start:6318 stop:7007 length:690 start_codon:yes stop_codon:yes gene_type:complete